MYRVTYNEVSLVCKTGKELDENVRFIVQRFELTTQVEMDCIKIVALVNLSKV